EAEAQIAAEETYDQPDPAPTDLPPVAPAPASPVSAVSPVSPVREEAAVQDEASVPPGGDGGDAARFTANDEVREETATITDRLLGDEQPEPELPPGAEVLQPNASESADEPITSTAAEAADRRAPRSAERSIDDLDSALEADDYAGEALASAHTRAHRQRWPDELTIPNDPVGRATPKTTAGAASAFEFMAMTPDESDGRYSAPVVPPHPLVRSDRRASAFSITGYSLDENAYSALLAACPDIARNPYLNLICNIVMRRSPSELRITTRTGAVFFPAENWVASNISTAFRKRLTQHEMMLQIVQVHQLQEEHAHDRAARLFGRRGDGPRSLDAFMWSLVFTTFEQSPPVSVGDLHFQVHRFPNFARLHKMPDLFSQLSQVCMRQPQSLSGLKRAFSKYDPNLVTLFVACTILSGVATVLQTSSSASSEAASRSKRDPERAAARRTGLFRSLLDKLF
ncbi:MAG: hypothetical protein RKP46_02610, partial [Candidatus Accumulibacter sp.]